MKKKVGIDIDETIIPFIRLLLDKYNKAYEDNVKYDEVTDYRVHKFLKPECTNVFKEFVDKDFFANITFEAYIIDELTRLNEKYQLYFVTAGAPITIRDRDKMLSRNLEWYTSGQLIVCRDKGLLNLDYLVDDYEENCKSGNYIGLLLIKPWNLYSKYDISLRINGFNEVGSKIEWLEENAKRERQLKYERLSDEWLED